MSNKIIVEEFLRLLQNKIKNVPKGFYDTFKYTKTGCNFTHPITIGFIIEAMKSMNEKMLFQGVDLHINFKEKKRNKIKFQPDVVGFKEIPKLVDETLDAKYVLFVDYESPNSSDMRVVNKDIRTYLKWRKTTGQEVPYVILTTLPEKPVNKDDWEIRHTSSDEYGGLAKNKKDQLRKSPFKFWFPHYKNALDALKEVNDIYLINISEKTASIKYPKIL